MPMEDKSARPDKKVYNYTKALNQPVWIQKITDQISLPVAIRMSDIGWIIFFAYWILRLALFLSRVTPAPFAFWFVPALASAFYLAMLVSDLTIDKKPFLRFVGDYVKFYRRYGSKRRSHVINDGLFYHKPSKILEKEGYDVNRK